MVAGSRPVPIMAAAPSSNLRYPSPSWRQAMNDKIVVHVIDDDAAMRDSMAFLLDVNGFKPLVYDSASAFLKRSPIDALSCVVSDIRMPGMNGIELVRELKSKGSACPVILVTGHGDVALAVE